MKILIITGGTEREREISLWSARDVHKALVEAGYGVEEFDYKDGDEKLRKKLAKFDLALPMIHGEEGEGGQLQQKLEEWKVDFLGPSSVTCFRGWNKFDFKRFCEENNINTPKWKKISAFNQINISYPFVLKPADEGSSFDFYIINSKADLNKINEEKLFKKYENMLIEEFIDGDEVTSGIWIDKILPLVEIKPPEGEVFNFENKYNGKTAEIAGAPGIAKDLQEKVKAVTEEIKVGLNIRDFSRVDYLLRDGEVFALEINTIPAFTSESLLPKALKEAGMSLAEAFDLLIKSHSN